MGSCSDTSGTEESSTVGYSMNIATPRPNQAGAFFCEQENES